MEAYLLVAGTLLACGVIGGLYNYFSDKNDVCLAAWLLGGIIASWSVPLFLFVIGSDDLRKILENPVWTKPEWSAYHFKLVGFCLLAAVFSRRFLQTLSDRIFEQLREQKKRIEETSREVLQQKCELVTITDAVVEGNLADVDVSAKLDYQLSEDEILVLKCFLEGTIALRSPEGLGLSVGFDLKKMTGILRRLESRKLIEEVTTRKGNRWRLTEMGRVAAVKPSRR